VTVKVQTSFDPQVHGYQFTNRFSGGAVIAELNSQDRLSELTGLKTPNVLRELTDLAQSATFWGDFGLCGGMSWGAVDGYETGQAVDGTRAIPGRGTEIFRSLVARQADSMKGRSLLERCLIWQLLPDQTPLWMFWSKGVGRLTVEREWPRLKAALDAGRPWSVLLIRNHGIASPGDHHQAVAIGYETGDGVVNIDLYDPNHPRARPTVPIDLNARTCGPRQSTGERTRGFFLWDRL
jgi:hypothetical protein